MIKDLLYDDDCDLVYHNKEQIQILMDRQSQTFGLTVSLDKKKLSCSNRQHVNLILNLQIYVYGQRLQVEDVLTYLVGTIIRQCILDDEITTQV